MDRDIVSTLAYSKSMEVLSFLNSTEETRFTSVCDELQLNPNVVNKRLKDLKHTDLVKKENKHYEITEKGKKALKLCKDLGKI